MWPKLRATYQARLRWKFNVTKSAECYVRNAVGYNKQRQTIFHWCDGRCQHILHYTASCPTWSRIAHTHTLTHVKRKFVGIIYFSPASTNKRARAREKWMDGWMAVCRSDRVDAWVRGNIDGAEAISLPIIYVLCRFVLRSVPLVSVDCRFHFSRPINLIYKNCARIECVCVSQSVRASVCDDYTTTFRIMTNIWQFHSALHVQLYMRSTPRHHRSPES